MNEAAELFKDELEKVSFAEPQIPLYSNVTALAYSKNAPGNAF